MPRECRANVVDNSGAAAIIGPVSGLGGGARRPMAGVTSTRARRTR
jgi:hypothetical protein